MHLLYFFLLFIRRGISFPCMSWLLFTLPICAWPLCPLQPDSLPPRALLFVHSTLKPTYPEFIYCFWSKHLFTVDSVLGWDKMHRELRRQYSHQVSVTGQYSRRCAEQQIRPLCSRWVFSWRTPTIGFVNYPLPRAYPKAYLLPVMDCCLSTKYCSFGLFKSNAIQCHL